MIKKAKTLHLSSYSLVSQPHKSVEQEKIITRGVRDANASFNALKKKLRERTGTQKNK